MNPKWVQTLYPDPREPPHAGGIVFIASFTLLAPFDNEGMKIDMATGAKTSKAVNGNGSNDHAKRAIRVLLVEDSEPDAFLLIRALDKGGFKVTSQRVSSEDEMKGALQKHSWDVILADHSMPQFSAPDALQLVQENGLDIPFIIVSGHIEEDTAISAMRSGAHDYVMKGRLARLVPAVERELREAEMRAARRRTEQELLSAQEQLEMRVEERTADLRAAYEKLERVVEDRKRLEAEILEIAENERRRIGFDLHDDLGQKLAGVSLILKGTESKLRRQQNPCADDVAKVHELITEITEHTHNLARQFSSLNMQGADLPGVLKELAGNVKRMFDVSCTFSGRGTVPEIPQNTIAQIYKIVQEAVSNAIKHGKARHVSIGLVATPGNLVVTVKNDGLPFNPPGTNSKRMGLRIMDYRASTINATLDIKPAEKQGTLVTCAVGLSNGASKPKRREEAPLPI